jgi:hypothetical protein
MRHYATIQVFRHPRTTHVQINSIPVFFTSSRTNKHLEVFLEGVRAMAKACAIEIEQWPDFIAPDGRKHRGQNQRTRHHGELQAEAQELGLIPPYIPEGEN